MLQGTGPKFVEATGKQLVCPYCQYKFRAPQGTRDQISNYYIYFLTTQVTLYCITSLLNLMALNS